MLSSVLNYFYKTEKKENFYYLSLLKNDNNIYCYSIHGLWPNFADDTYPSFCKKVEFDINKLKPIMKDLMDFWELPKDHNKEEDSFWKHEWLKHGSCMFLEMDELTYFKKALDLYLDIMNKKLNIEKYKKGRSYMIPLNLNFEIEMV